MQKICIRRAGLRECGGSYNEIQETTFKVQTEFEKLTKYQSSFRVRQAIAYFSSNTKKLKLRTFKELKVNIPTGS